MGNLVAAAVLVGLLFVSTSFWALSQARATGSGQQSNDIVRARLWAAAMSFALLTVIIVASWMALLSAGTSGTERLVRAVSSPVVVAGLLLCAVVAAYPAYLCMRIWRSDSGRVVERLHLTLHMGAVYAVVVLLLELGSPAW
jgi:choline-glycine betaine transporter